MKKLFFLTLLSTVCTLACTTKEQDEQIRSFWMDQAAKAGSSSLAPFIGAVTNKLSAPEEAPQEEAILTEQTSQIEVDSAGLSIKDKLKMQHAAPAAAPQQKLTASLYLSPTCPWCKKLKQEGFTKKFNKKHGDLIVLTEYTLDNNQNMNLYSAAIKKYKLSGGVPLLIIGDTPIQGYSPELLSMASEAAEKEIKKHKLTSEKEMAMNTPAVLEISLEDEQIKGPASEKDKQKMKELMLDMQDANGAMIQSIGDTFGPIVKNQAMELAANTEKQLKTAAGQSKNFAEFAQKYKQISEQNTKGMDKLMRSNTDKIRRKR